MKISVYGTGVHISPLGLSEYERNVLRDLERIKGKPAARLMGDVFLMDRVGLGRIHEPLEVKRTQVQLDSQLRFEVRYGRKRRSFSASDIKGDGWLMKPFTVSKTEAEHFVRHYRADYVVGAVAKIDLPIGMTLQDFKVRVIWDRMVWVIEDSDFQGLSIPEIAVRRREFVLENE